MESADRHQRGDDRRGDERRLHEAGGRARREVGQDRRRRGTRRLDPGLRGSWRDRADRQLHREVQGAGDDQGHPSRVPVAREVQREDLRVLRRRRRVDALLPQGRLRERQAAGRLPGEVRQVAARPSQLGRDDRDVPVHHRSDGSEDLRPGTWTGARQPRQLLLLHADVPLLRGPVLRPEDDEGDRSTGRRASRP